MIHGKEWVASLLSGLERSKGVLKEARFYHAFIALKGEVASARTQPNNKTRIKSVERPIQKWEAAEDARSNRVAILDHHISRLTRKSVLDPSQLDPEPIIAKETIETKHKKRTDNPSRVLRQLSIKDMFDFARNPSLDTQPPKEKQKLTVTSDEKMPVIDMKETKTVEHVGVRKV
jgi:hypothetical protein